MASGAGKKGRKKKTSARPNNKKTGSTKSASSVTKRDELLNEVIILFTCAVALILMLSNFGLAGVIGEGISWLMFGLVGLVEYIFPLIIAGSVIFLMANRELGIARIKTAAVYVAVIVLCGLVQMFTRLPGRTEGIGEFFIYSSKNRLGGGFFGGLLVKLLNPVGTAGAFVILVILILISIIVITEKSFIGGVKKGSSKVYRSAKEDYSSYREHSAERRSVKHKDNDRRDVSMTDMTEHMEYQEEERSPRMEKKVRGVALNTMIPREVNAKNVDLHEISMDFDRVDEYSKDIYEPVTNDVDSPRSKSKGISETDSEVEYLESEGEITDKMAPERARRSRKTKSAGMNVSDSSDTDAEFQSSVSAQIEQSSEKHKGDYVFPPVDLLDKNTQKGNIDQNRENRETAMRLQQTLQNFGVKVTVTDISCGPSVTRYEIQPEQGVKVSRIVSLSDDIKLNLAAADIRIEAPIPGKAAVGIEVPNKETTGVMLREVIESEAFAKSPSPIAFAAGRDISGKIIVADIAKMPHLLIAGATGSGKSVCINTIIMSILYKSRPDDVKLIMIDPKVVELSVYNGIPHLMIPVVTDPKKASGALNWAVAEMTERYKKFAEQNVRDLKGYNEKIKVSSEFTDETRPAKMPQIVIIIDELADLMMVAPGEVEDAICRLAQLARAAGIHLVVATQRPSVNVITGLIKANVPSRIAFSVSSGVDSRTIIDMNGAEKLLGKGDMLYYPSGLPKPVRVQGTFVSDKEVSRVVSFLKEHIGEAVYNDEVTTSIETVSMNDSQAFGGDRDAYFAEAGRFIIEKEKGSIGMLQRYYKIGFNRAARIMDQLADAGVVGPEEGTKPRKILMTMEEFEDLLNEV